MPQIRCPTCGTTINLESRRETDFRMIISMLEKEPKTFTELLRGTGLPRKTLSLRLKELCASGIIIKNGGYQLNGSPPPHLRSKLLNFKGNGGNRLFILNKKVLLLVLILCIGIPVSGYVYANYAPKPVIPPEEPKTQYYGFLIVKIGIKEVTNLYAWQARINYDTEILEFRNISRGEEPFFKNAIPRALYSTDSFEDIEDDLLVGDSLMGIDTVGVNGSGTLAIITFAIKAPGKTLEYFKENPPVIVFDPQVAPAIRTHLLSEYLGEGEWTEIPGAENLLYLEVVDVIEST